jgi:hypothetical protein
MRRRSFLRLALSCVLVVAALGGSPPSGLAGTSGSGEAITPRSLPASVIASVLNAPGFVVRNDGDIRVERVSVPPSLRTAGVPGAVFRVRVQGSFPPRALRYTVTAGGRPVAFGIPSARLGSLVAVTADPAVVTEPVRVRYGGHGVEAGAIDPASTEPAASGTASVAAPMAMGPLEVTKRVYDLGDQAFQPTGLGGKVELVADVHFPKGVPGGPYPLVLLLHGNHSSCYRGMRAGYTWPCRPGWTPLPNYEGYDYLARRLASFGYIVVSVSGNGVNVLGNRVEDTGMRQRGELLERHLELWRDWSTTGGDPFGSRFVDKVDLASIGTMGHSRGGEGAVWQVIVDRERPDPFGIDAVLPLAPVDFTRATVNEVPMAVMLPYCDGDVYDLQGVHFFDDARYRLPGDPTPKQTVTVFGANHNFFNTVWTPTAGYPGAFDDGTRRCEDRLRAVEQRHVGSAYIVSFFRRYVGGDLSQDSIWTGARPAPGVSPARALTSYLAPDTFGQRLDLDRFTDPTSLSRNELGGAVVSSGMSAYGWCEDTVETPCVAGKFAFADIHLPGLARGILGWADPTASVRFRLPDGTGNVQGFDALQMRTALDPGYWVNRVAFQDLVVTLIDGDGGRDDVTASSVGNEALAYPPGLRRFAGHVILQQLRFPLDTFDGVDLTNIRSVLIRFSRTDAGVIHVADLAFSSGSA